MRGEDVPGRMLGVEIVDGPHHMRHDHPAGGEAVGIDMPNIATDRIEEAVHLALGMVEAAGARPAIGAAEYRLIAVLRPNARELPGDAPEGFLPRYFDERFAAALVRPSS